ncbi:MULTISPECIES: hypothetical protein [unclassified Ochrobactrum]|jgi:hypothetical protein|uniref:hypothetical protein n=1 Tax=unclassified Ochrobactrum TaxID=239106 RepID=UPI000DEF4935|nr:MULTISPECIES: hypothetical protein [unclassified Ochrobactrum]MBQ0708711.1 hypothetical protein [Ochrobactrum sp. AP1BH01-1]
MAKLPALIEKLARFDPRGVSAVENLSREMRREGLITSGKRGVGAPEMTSSDVTNLLFAMVARQSKDAPAAVKALREATMVATWEEVESGIVDQFWDSLSIKDRIYDGDGMCRAGTVVDVIIDEFIEDGAIGVGEDFEIDVSLEIHDPATGNGEVQIYFRRGRQDEKMYRFNADHLGGLSFGIQQAAIIPSEVIHQLADTLRKED